MALLLLILLLPQTAAAAEFVDQDGTRIVFDRPFSRIISLYPAHTENLVELGATEQIIGVSRGDNPDAVRLKETYSDGDSAEKFLAAAPDLVLVRPMISRAHPALLARLRDSGITVVSRAEDNVGNVETPGDGVSFVISRGYSVALPIIMNDFGQ